MSSHEDPNDTGHQLPLTAFSGVGPRMERRLNLYGVFHVEQFCQMSAKALGEVWGSKLLGERWFRILRGEDVIDKVSRRQTVSHSHVLPPELRTDEKAYAVLVRLTHKAAARLRKIGYWAGGVSVGVRYKDGGGWDAGCRFPCCQDTLSVLQELGELWKRRPEGGVPFKIGMVLFDLVPARSATPSLFEYDRKMTELSHAMDGANREFGSNVVYFGTMWGMADHAPNRIAFTQIPDFDRTVS
jgi:DNA polymerase-4